MKVCFNYIFIYNILSSLIKVILQHISLSNSKVSKDKNGTKGKYAQCI